MQGNAKAQFSFAASLLVAKGGLIQDVVKSRAWFSIAAAYGYKDKEKLKIFNTFISRVITPDQIRQSIEFEKKIIPQIESNKKRKDK